MSPFQFLLSKEDFADVCEELFTSPDLKPTWKEAFDQCKNYRDYLSTLSIDDRLKSKAYLLRKEDIELLLTQAGNNFDGIRIYIGHEKFGNGDVAVRLFCVACEKNRSGGYDDWQIPPKSNPTTASSELGESRPCPDECGNDNDLNHP